MRLCVIGSFNPDDPAHVAIEPALKAAGGDAVEVAWIEPGLISEEGVVRHLTNADGIVGAPGEIADADGYLDAIEFAREGPVPYLGVEVGMDLACVEVARTLLSLPNAHSIAFDPATPQPIIVELVAQELVRGHTIPILGNCPVKTTGDGRYRSWVGGTPRLENHRVALALNTKYRVKLTRAGLKFTATDETGFTPRAIELTDHPFFVAIAFMPFLDAATGDAPAGIHPVVQAFCDAVRDA